MGGTEKTTLQQKKLMQKSPQIWEKLKKLNIKKLHAEINFSMDRLVNCRVLIITLGADLEKFKDGNITNCFKPKANITQDY